MNISNISISKKSIAKIAIVTLAILLIPLVAMQLTDEVSWKIGDFIVATILLSLFGYFYELLTKNSTSSLKKSLVAVFVFGSLIFIWVVLAVELL